MEKKMTYVEAITTAMESADLTPEVTARLNDLIASLTKKTVSKAQQAKQERAEAVKSAIAEAIGADWMGLADIMASVPATKDMTVNQVVPLLTALRKDGIVEAEKHKGKMEYRLASAEAVEE